MVKSGIDGISSYAYWFQGKRLGMVTSVSGVTADLPEVQRSFCCNTASGMAYFRYISQELQ